MVDARCEHDDGWVQAEVDLPAVLSCAERLIEPARSTRPGRGGGARADRIRRLHAADLGAGPVGRRPAAPHWVGRGQGAWR